MHRPVVCSTQTDIFTIYSLPYFEKNIAMFLWTVSSLPFLLSRKFILSFLAFSGSCSEEESCIGNLPSGDHMKIITLEKEMALEGYLAAYLLSIKHGGCFFQITFCEFFWRFNDNFHYVGQAYFRLL